MLTRRDSYAAMYRDFAWDIPARFNIGTAVSDAWAAREPERIALLEYRADGEPDRLTYGDLASRSNALASALRARGVRRGDRIALLLPQAFETAIAHVAIYKLGAIAVPLALLFGVEALEYRLHAAGVKAVITNAAGLSKVARLAQRLPMLELLVSVDGAGEGAEDFHRLLAEAEIQLGEAAGELRRYLGGLEMDPARLDAVQSRLESLKELARKHQVEPDALPARQASLAAEIEELEQAEIRLGRSAERLAAAERSYRRAAMELSAARKAAAAAFSEQVTVLMRQLGMPGGHFAVAVEHDPEGEGAAHGLDQVEFLVSANPGQPPAPVARVASGGELSRISLAIQVAAKSARPVPVMVFDEVDSGVGGGIAEIVGRRLAELGERTQVLCVTHLAQVASQADQHVRVVKLTDGETTRTTLKPLTEAEKVEELARMLGGVEITATTRAHAREMRKRAHRA